MIYALDEMTPQCSEGSWVADTATLIGDVRLGRDASVWFGCVLRGDNDALIIGAGSNIQDGSVLHTDHGLPLRVGEGCTVGHLAMLHGCEVGDNTLIGIKAVVLNRARIGRNCIVAANALVTEGKQFPDGVMIMGAPAKVVRELLPQEIEMLQAMARHYVENARRYRRSLVAVTP
ncbi:gamma carbonic anhydrase family protein [Sinimarinibacterium sp. CAU 1509]|uniref:gamma carbonic anhydrase family protein n=1 Tax=Sinimarinibacterium sp. CAU 1509 TaxID=2562283 RepID=UPI0010AD99E0|nr:gamma carbonic anhydrase family protein [Sinimarinibacterium sp. CAU 1509]TJY62152.1 gamma carbonic anhydrase family protein [Sinimarinibacterium sp. CAU 1509]